MQENYKILVVDDDMRLRALLERYLAVTIMNGIGLL